MLTIGAFARASRLSPKALRLYDELGLLTPAMVDPVSGYRFYQPEQLDRARLVARLRQLGMPLARIKVVCDLRAIGAAAEAAAEVAAYWREIETDVHARRELAAFLIDRLSGKEAEMSKLSLQYAVRSDQGLVRESNQDAAYAGSHLFAVADGFGAGKTARPASVVAIEAIKPLDMAVSPADLHAVLDDAAHRASTAVRTTTGPDERVGTTLTAMLWSGSRFALAHIGDSRVYLLRDGELRQLTHDHTLVQSMVDDGRLTPEEAASHPERAMLLKALYGGNTAEPDIELRQAEAGDRYLLCSDGLYTAITTDDLREVMTMTSDPTLAAGELIDLANGEGGPDNITCVVADLTAI